MLVGSGSEVPSSLTTFQNEHAKMKVVSGLPGVPQHNLGMVGCLKCGRSPAIHRNGFVIQGQDPKNLDGPSFFEKSKSWKPCPNLRLYNWPDL